MNKHNRHNDKRGNDYPTSKDTDKDVVKGVAKQVLVMAELVEEGVKESRINNSYSRRVIGKNRDAARRDRSKLNRRKTQHNRS